MVCDPNVNCTCWIGSDGSAVTVTLLRKNVFGGGAVELIVNLWLLTMTGIPVPVGPTLPTTSTARALKVCGPSGMEMVLNDVWKLGAGRLSRTLLATSTSMRATPDPESVAVALS